MNAATDDARVQARVLDAADDRRAGADDPVPDDDAIDRAGSKPAHSSRRSFLGRACTGLALAATNLPDVAEAGPVRLRSGLAWASGCFSDPDRFVSLYRRRPLDILNVYLAKNSWQDIAGAGGIGGHVTGRSETIMISYPLFPENYNPTRQGAGLWRRAASGEFDRYHASSASNLGRYKRKFVFRIGWEWNNNAMPWACHDVRYAESYIRYFQRVVNLLRDRNRTA